MKSIPEQAKGNIPRRSIFETHFGQTQARPLNEAPSRRTPSRRGGGEFLAKYHPDAFPKEPRVVKTPLRGKISPLCIQNELILARFAPHVFKMPCKAPFGNTSRGYLAIKAPFSRPNPSNHAQWANIATLFRLAFRVGALRFLSAWELGARPALRFVLHCGISVLPA